MNLEGKIINFLGDSITEGRSVEDIENCRYDNILKRECKLKATYNYGIGGSRIAHQRVPSEKPRHDLCFCARAYDLNPDADIIVVFGGTNDYGRGDAPFGEFTDKTPATFCGGVDFLINILMELYPNARLVFMTPAHREGDAFPSTVPSKLDDAKPLIDYVNVIKTKCNEYNIPVLDIYTKLGIDINKPSDRNKYSPDGVHFNNEGQKVIAKRLIEFLRVLD